ncbi:hypothetical protein AZE42_08159 [Rhizopogon vesiculosus]|uniref:Cyclopropane-fatty-acyl-phospholipid synthase n=1 Tax=Rhizopogon vesiculosus TaxID=180088 RepID=A0A1J8QGX7_9AGAM|nr:hypothetical protein AZE42_08159 [Rhizopogon vesiculosus]
MTVDCRSLITLKSFAGTTLVYSYFLDYAKSCVVSSLKSGLKKGNLLIHDGGDVLYFGQTAMSVADKPHLSATISIVNPNFWARVYLSHDLGFAEAFMHGDFIGSPSDVKTILDLWIQNREHLFGLSSYVNHASVLLSALYVRAFGQSLSNAKLNAMTGYDVCNDFFKSFLSKDMTYSCAVFPENTGGVRGDLTKAWKEDDLYAAQIHKIHLLLESAHLRSGDRLLEFGTGWGQLSIEVCMPLSTEVQFT